MSTNNGITRSSTAAQAASSSNSSSSMRRVAFLTGHTDSVICLNVSPHSEFLASGSEDGMLCIHCLGSRELLCKTLLSKYNAVAAVLFVPNPGSSSSGGGVRRSLLFAAAGCELLLLAFEVAAVAAAVPDGEVDQQQQHCKTTAAAAAAAAAADLDVLCRSKVTDDDISALAINRQGTYLTAADDAGDVTIFDLSNLHHQQQQQQQQVLQPVRVIRSAHVPLASAVSFRSHKPWQLLTGGMDNRIACWDFSRAKKCLAAWNMTEVTEISNPGGVSQPGRVSNPGRVGNPGQHGVSHPQPGVDNPQPGVTHPTNDCDESSRQLWNPPMVHAMAMPADSSGSSSGSGSGQQQQQQVVVLPAAVRKRIVAAARGDGVIAVFDADGDAKPSSSSSSSSSRAAASAAAAASPTQNSMKGPAKAQASSLQQQHAAAAVVAVPSLQQDQAAHAAAAEAQLQQQVIIQPGFHVCLGPSVGGHTVPASAVVFLPLGSDPLDMTRFLVSAGEDGRLLLWDWQLALLPQQQQQQRGEGAKPNQQQQQQQQQQQAFRGTCLLVDKDHKRKVNALCCVPGGFHKAGSQGVAGKVTTQAASNVERCLLFVADTSTKICVYEVTSKL